MGLPAGNPAATIGLVPGEGSGPALVAATRAVLETVAEVCRLPLSFVEAGDLGMEGRRFAEPLADELCDFFARIFAAGGAILCGPGGGRFVYTLRRRFDLYKLVPVRPLPALAACRRVRWPARLDELLLVRENVGGLYFSEGAPDARGLSLRCRLDRRRIRRFLDTACSLAAARGVPLQLALKDGGLPGPTALWREELAEAAARQQVATEVLNVDLAAYRLIQEPDSFTVLAAPNLYGDVLADVSALLLGQRSVSFSGNFGPGAAVYQTNHGAAWDLAGSDRANPVGQILSGAMLLRESFGFDEAAGLVEGAVDAVLRSGRHTADLALGGELLGTRAFTAAVCAALRARATASTASAPARTAG